MHLILVAVKDRAIDAFMQPLFVRHRSEAVRMFGDELKRPESSLSKHPDDYDLYFIGVWDDASGQFKDMDRPPELLVRGKDLKGESNVS